MPVLPLPRPIKPAPAARRTGQRVREAVRPALLAMVALVPVSLLIVIGYFTMDLWSAIPGSVAPRHRAEAVCFALARADVDMRQTFAPPMRIEPSAALIQGRFAPGTETGLALRQVMRLDESMVIGESRHPVGDYVVSVLWLNLPPGASTSPVSSTGTSGAGHWLVLAWMEGADLAVCNFHFVGAADEGSPGSRGLSPDEVRWGSRLLDRALVPENFRAGSLPRIRLRARGSSTMPVFGPASTH